MTPCRSCSRHLRATDSTCPFCGAARDRLSPALRRGLNAVVAIATPVFLAACYGSPGIEPKECDSGSDCTLDLDGDGWEQGDDCDDGDNAVNPDATEICDDGIDNNCDTLTDADDPTCQTAR